MEFVGIAEFFYNCRNSGKCCMKLIPPIYNNRNVCDREVIDDDVVSSSYVYYTLDSTGNKRFCKTCALRNHSQHDIHHHGYMKFDCCETNPISNDQISDQAYNRQPNSQANDQISGNQVNSQTFNNQANNQTCSNQDNNQTSSNKNRSNKNNDVDDEIFDQVFSTSNKDDDCLIQ